MFVALAQKPLTVCELQAALGVDIEVIWQPSTPRTFANTIKKLCCPLIGACPRNNTLKLVHHSVKAFLIGELRAPQNWDITGVEDFFIDEAKGNTYMALVCLSYLSSPSSPQIELPIDRLTPQVLEGLTTIATGNEFTKENDFMKYAAIYWHVHAEAAEVTQVLVKALLAFLRSPNFIACLRVRSRHAPYHFSTFISCDGCTFMAFADTMPGWLESTELVLGSEGKEMAFQYYSFVKEWGHVLIRYPGEIERCLIGTLGSIFFSPIETTADTHFLDAGKRVQSLDAKSLNFTSVASLQGEEWILQLQLIS